MTSVTGAPADPIHDTVTGFPSLAEEYGIAGGVLAVWRGGVLRHASADGAPEDRFDPTTLVPVTCVSKPMTATLVMQLVDRGDVDLDRPVGEYVPEFRPSDRQAAEQMTVRRLLSHSSGLPADDIEDKGAAGRPFSAQASLARFVARSRHLRWFLPPGEIYSSSNVGYVILARLVEVATAMPWPRALSEGLLAPLGLRHTVWRQPDAASTTAAGCEPVGPDSVALCPPLWSTPADVLGFARLHLAGREPALRRMLSDQAVAAMRTPHVDIPDPAIGRACGLGWKIFDQDGRLIGHWGEEGTYATGLWLLPFDDTAVVAMARSGEGGAEGAEWMLLDVCGRMFASLLAYGPPPRPTGDPSAFSPGIEGTYELPGFRFWVGRRNGSMVLAVEQTTPRASSLSPLAGRVFPLTATQLAGDVIARGPGSAKLLPRFRCVDPSGRFKYLHLWDQSAIRVD